MNGLRSDLPVTPERGASSWLAQRASLTPGREAIVDGDLRLSYAAFAERCWRVAGALRAAGVRAGDRVATLALNGVDQAALFYATARLGALLAPLNWRLAPAELGYQLGDLDARVLYADEANAALADRIAGAPARIALDADAEPADERDEARFADPHVILYTAGTTGHAKGAVLTHANVFWNVVNVTIGFGLSERDTTATVLPMFHSGGIGLFTVPTLTIGGRVIVLPKFDAARLLDAIVGERVDLVFGVPAIWLELAKDEGFTPQRYPSLRCLPSGGAPLPRPLMDRLHARGFTVLQGYGLTETAPGGTILAAEDAVRKAGTVGRPFPFVRLRVVDEAGRPAAAGDVGEVHFHGPNVFAGYWRNAAATAEAFTEDGWFRSGDLGSLDEEGFLTLVDRKKDMVITGGENVYSAEVEDVLFAHPAVAEAAIVGAPDERWGEMVVAVVVLRPGQAATEQELIAFCAARLAKYKTPKRVVFRDALPRNAAGKVLKRDLREEVRPPPVPVAR